MNRIIPIFCIICAVIVLQIQISKLNDGFVTHHLDGLSNVVDIQVAPESPCGKCNHFIFKGIECKTGPKEIDVDYFYYCAHCLYLKCVASWTTVHTMGSNFNLWGIKSPYKF